MPTYKFMLCLTDVERGDKDAPFCAEDLCLANSIRG